MNTKELTDVKELVDEALGKIALIVEILQTELDGPGEPSRENEDHDADVGEDDGPMDPLEDGRVAAVHAYDLLAAVLDITEPHRKRYAAQRSVANKRGNTSGNTSGNTVASLERQATLPGSDSVLKENVNGKNKKSRSFRRPLK